MDIPIHADVVCTDGVVGKSSHIIVDLVSERVTHFVVRTSHDHNRFVVPIDKIEDTERTAILLACNKEEVHQLPVFDESHYHGYDAYESAPPMPSPGMSAPDTLYQPYRTADSPAEDPAAHFAAVELAIKRGADVLASDARVGKVDEFVIDPETYRITHLVLRQHFLLNKWIVTIPVSEIEQARGNTVLLKIDKKAVEALPAVALKRFPWE
jgi:sporulation protein YlmC with PRC-barrel domain